MVSTGNGFLVRTSARNSGVAAYITYSVRLQTAFLQKIGASRRYRSGCPTIRRGHLPLFDRIVTQFPLPPRHSREAKQGTSGNRAMEAGSRRSKPGTSFLPYGGQLTHRHQVIALDQLSPRGYEMKHAVLHKAGDFDNSVDALETMLSKIAQSPDPSELYPCYHYKDNLFTLFGRI